MSFYLVLVIILVNKMNYERLDKIVSRKIFILKVFDLMFCFYRYDFDFSSVSWHNVLLKKRINLLREPSDLANV